MENSKLIQLLKSLSLEEFRRFGQFVSSPFFNRLKNVIKFYEVLKKYYPEFSNRNLIAEKVFIKIFPEETFKYAKMKNLESDLLKLCEEYLSFIGFRENRYETDKFLLTELRKRKLIKLFESNYKRANKNLENSKYKDENFYFIKFILENQNILNITNNKLYYDQEALQRQLDYFIDFFLLQVLRLYSFMVHQKKYLYDFDFSLTFLDEVVNYISKNANGIKPLILLQFNDMMLSLKGEEIYYKNLKDMTDKYSDIIDPTELYNIYASLSRFLQLKYDENSNKYIDEIFELYKTILKKGIFKSYFHMSNIFFIKTADFALRKKDYKFLEDFINEYKDRLPPEHTSNTLNYCSALRYFYEKNYNQALEKLSTVDTQDYSYKLIIKSLSLRIFYELNSIDSIESLVDTFRHFILNNKLVPDIVKNDYLNFVNYFNRLHKIRNDIESEDIGFFKKEIAGRQDIALKYWLLEKIEELQ
ncbi:MAG: hypothetical protein ACRDFC_08930 [Ignavibacteria bacterium]